MPSREHVDLLLRKAAQDVFTIMKLQSDLESPDEVIGFHAQQAIEKMLKAVLVHANVAYRRTHDLVELIDLLRFNGITLPTELEDVRFLNPFAVSVRYDDIPVGPEEPFDRAWAAERVGQIQNWVVAIVHSNA